MQNRPSRHLIQHPPDAPLEDASLKDASLAANAYLSMHRNLWGLTYRGSTAGNDLVDDDITFRIRPVARRRR